MREIKFRAWLKNQKKMIYPYALDFLHKTWVANKDLYGSFDEIELMQFTSLKDKFGKEVYEGDLISFKGAIYVVKYFNQYGKFALSDNVDPDSLPIIIGNPSNYKVIGNIYENEV